MELDVSDWVLVGSTIVLGAIAILGPTFADRFRSWLLSPDLRVSALTAPPDCHKTSMVWRHSASQAAKHPIYYYRLRVKNEGKTQARRCEVLLEGLEIADAAGRFVPFSNFTPVRLRWDSKATDFTDINPERWFFCNVFTVPFETVQSEASAAGFYVDLQGATPPTVGVVLEVESVYFVQPNRLPPGKYRLGVAVHSENAPTSRSFVEISWSGHWRDEQTDMFRECVMVARAAS